jgi:uncharacterized protein (TIGR02453 family)
MSAVQQQETEFTGFSRKTISFLSGVERNNRQDWFEQHRADYDRHYVAPARAFVEAIRPELTKLRPGIGIDPDHNGKGSIKKIFTDRRFNPDRDPYKPWLDIMFWEGPLKAKKDNSVLALRLEPKRLTFFGGVKHMDRPVLKAWRAAALEDGAGLASELKKVLKDTDFTLCEPGYAKLPRGVDPSHPHAELLLHDAMFVYKSQSLPGELYSAEFVPYAMAQFREFAPFHGWLAAMLNQRLQAVLESA